MLQSIQKTSVKKHLFRLVFVGLITITLSFDTPPETLSPYAAGTPPTIDVREDAVKRLMTTASDSALTILNGNLWMLPARFSTDKEERIDRFVAYARSLMPHVITLQEVWTKNQVKYLKKWFPEYRVHTPGGRGPFNKAGLVTLTRIPTDSVAFAAFEVGRGASRLERKAGKGYLTVRLAGSIKACIINTHLYAPTNQREQAFALKQFNTLKRLAPNGDYFIVGDLNLTQKTFERVNDSFFATERDTAYTVDAANVYRSRGANSDKEKHSYKVDRLLMPHAYADRFVLRSMLIREPVVSDHYLLAYRIERQPVLPHIAESISE